MKIFAVRYAYIDDSEALNRVRPDHRAWLAGLLDEGILLASGPMVDSPNALLIFRSESLEGLGELLNNDPFDIAGFIDARVIEEWNPVFGPFAN